MEIGSTTKIEQLPHDLGTYVNYISGPDKLCPGETKTYAITIGAVGTVNWSVPAGLTVVSGAGTPSVQIKNVSSTLPTSNITASVQPTTANVNGSRVTLVKAVGTHTPSPYVTYSRTGPTGGHYSHHLVVAPVAGTTYTMYMGPVGGGAGTVTYTGTSNYYSSGSATIWWHVVAWNSCGGEDVANHTLYRNGNANDSISIDNSPKKSSLFPNPANNELTLLLSTTYALEKSVKVNLLDITGKLISVHEINNPNEPKIIDVKNLVAGDYIISIISDVQSESIKFIKE